MLGIIAALDYFVMHTFRLWGKKRVWGLHKRNLDGSESHGESTKKEQASSG